MDGNPGQFRGASNADEHITLSNGGAEGSPTGIPTRGTGTVSNGSSHSPPALQIDEVRGGPEVIDALAGEWEALATRADSSMSFLLPALVRAYHQAFAPETTLVILTARRQGRLVGVLPLVECSVGFGALSLRWLRSAGNVHFPRFDVLYEPRYRDALAQCLWKHLSFRKRWRLVLIKGMPLGGVVDRMRRSAEAAGVSTYVRDSGETPYLPLDSVPDGEEGVIAIQSKRHRNRLRRGLKRLQQHGEAQLVVRSGEAGDEGLVEAHERFYALEHAGWKGAAATSVISAADTRCFYDSLVRDPQLRKHYVSFELVVNGEVIASDVGLKTASTFFSLKCAYDERFADCSPGHLLMLYELAALGRMGLGEWDLGGMAEPYKMAWTSQVRPFGALIVFRPGIGGRLASGLLYRVADPVIQQLKSEQSDDGSRSLSRIRSFVQEVARSGLGLASRISS